MRVLALVIVWGSKFFLSVRMGMIVSSRAAYDLVLKQELDWSQ